jgi:hypothetical protein
LDITQEALDVSLAIGTMRDYLWHNPKESIRAAGVELVEKLALDLYNASAKITAIAMNIKAEKTTKLQDFSAGRTAGADGERAGGDHPWLNRCALHPRRCPRESRGTSAN